MDRRMILGLLRAQLLTMRTIADAGLVLLSAIDEKKPDEEEDEGEKEFVKPPVFMGSRRAPESQSSTPTR